MIEIPDIVQLQGIGEFTSGDSSFKSDFQLIQYPAETVLLSSVPPSSFDSVAPLFVGNGFWILNGILEDMRPITCDRLLASRTLESNPLNTVEPTKYKFRFTPFNTIIEIGEKPKLPIKEALFPLVAFYEGPFTIVGFW